MGFWGSNPKPQDDDSSKEFVSGSDWGREPEAVSVEDTLEDPFQDSMGIGERLVPRVRSASCRVSIGLDYLSGAKHLAWVYLAVAWMMCRRRPVERRRANG